MTDQHHILNSRSTYIPREPGMDGGTRPAIDQRDVELYEQQRRNDRFELLLAITGTSTVLVWAAWMLL